MAMPEPVVDAPYLTTLTPTERAAVANLPGDTVTALAGKQSASSALSAISAGTNVAPLAATTALLESGAKAIASVTLIAFNTWADGQTIAVPGVAAHTIKKTSAGDIDVSGAADIAAAAAIVGAYMANHAGSLVDYVGTVGQVMTFRAKSYGRAINGQLVSGTLLTETTAMDEGVDPYDGRAVRSEVVYDADFAAATAVAVGGLSSSKRYRISWRATSVLDGGVEVDYATFYFLPNGSDANTHGWDWYANGEAATVGIYGGYGGAGIGGTVVIDPRCAGQSSFLSWSGRAWPNTARITPGVTSTDFTSLTLSIASVDSASGHLTIIEETP